jgi:phosphoglycerate dehydrogenase-like enzyme
MVAVAVLDDWQGVAASMADWSALKARADVRFHRAPLGSEDAAVAALADVEIVLTMRERMAFPARLVERLKALRMLSLTGARAPVIDTAALMSRGVTVCATGGERSGIATAELALGLMLAAERRIAAGDAAIRAGSFQSAIQPGRALDGRTLGIIGLGRIGALMARYGNALGMRVLAWSQNLTDDRAAACGAKRVSKEMLFAEADALSVHLVLSDRTRGVVSGEDIARMKPGAIIVNTSRAPLIDQISLLAAVRAGRIIAALDVYDHEPLPQGDAWRTAPNTVLTPHVGYCVTDVFRQFYTEQVENALAFLDGKPVRVMKPG